MNIDKKIQKNVSLSGLTTFKIGGRARFFVEVKNKEELQVAVEWAKAKNVSHYILGGGSNVLINDGLIDKLIIKISSNQIVVNKNKIIVGAGLDLGKLVQTSIKNNLTGLEWSVGIPGTVGGAVRGNAAAYNFSISETVEKIEVYDLNKNRFKFIDKRNCQFAYKNSLIKKKSGLIILNVHLKLKKEKSEKIKENASHYLTVRKNHPKLPSAGCIFKNLPAFVVRRDSPELYEEARENNIIRNKMISAGWIISKTKLPGKTIGGAQISVNHSNFVVNTGNAKAENVVILISLTKQKVRTDFNLQLQEEIEYLGF